MKTLYIIATPIGNLSDMTLRALETLKSVEAILCEDTRETGKLLGHFEIKNKLVSLHQHTPDEKIKSLLEQFENMAYCSDVGTPGISDPGNKLVELAVAAGVNVVPIPGACAAITALSVSGLPTDKFLFLGYMPHKSKNKIFKQIAASEITCCFYESTHRILKTLGQMKAFVGLERKIIVGRELTKKFETIYRGNIDEVLAQLKAMSKGEFVVIISGK